MATEPAGVLYRPTPLGEPLRPALEGPQAGAILRKASTLEELACVFLDHRDGQRRLVGLYPDAHLHVLIPLLSHPARRAPAGRKPRTSQPPYGRQEVRERSLKSVP